MSEIRSNEFPSAGSTVNSEGTDDPSMKDKAVQSAQVGKQAAGDLAQTATSKAQDVLDETTQQARNLVGEAREQLRGHAGDQHRNAVANLHSLADELHSMARSGQSSGVATDLVGQAADRTRGVASWLEQREPGDLVRELQQFARRRPGAFLAGALVAGVVAGRLTRGVVATHSDGSEGHQAEHRYGAVGTDVASAGGSMYPTADQPDDLAARVAPGVGVFGVDPESAQGPLR
ncbi:MAG: hypothetical protein JO147_04240 [Actinobacteria bacterium]|nr:hypothetical protein [Actinomycetota bacterium]